LEDYMPKVAKGKLASLQEVVAAAAGKKAIAVAEAEYDMLAKAAMGSGIQPMTEEERKLKMVEAFMAKEPLTQKQLDAYKVPPSPPHGKSIMPDVVLNDIRTRFPQLHTAICSTHGATTNFNDWFRKISNAMNASDSRNKYLTEELKKAEDRIKLKERDLKVRSEQAVDLHQKIREGKEERKELKADVGTMREFIKKLGQIIQAQSEAKPGYIDDFNPTTVLPLWLTPGYLKCILESYWDIISMEREKAVEKKLGKYKEEKAKELMQKVDYSGTGGDVTLRSQDVHSTASIGGAKIGAPRKVKF
jgi:hypothetical protein